MNPDGLDLSALQQALGAMRPEDLDALKTMAASMFAQEAPPKPDPPPSDGAFPFAPETVGKIVALLSALKNDAPDPRSELLLALRPMLKEERRHRVDQAAQMLRLMALLPKLKELGL
ncbi:MAG: hypothetical protein IKN72_06475 [Clostridia bacterium]|nr:hypothetical protein [Clostridia bacterium]MBR3553016.1 hypothetical protein [Clostridia bacterium]